MSQWAPSRETSGVVAHRACVGDLRLQVGPPGEGSEGDDESVAVAADSESERSSPGGLPSKCLG